ncbi:MAG: ribokinase [Acidobacteriaceae bacterium]
MRKPIVVVGSVNLDLVSKGKRIPAPGETVVGDQFQTFHGGKGANQAVAIARLGYPVSMFASVGDDEFGSRLRRGLQAEKVNVRAVLTAKNTASGCAMIAVDGKGQNSITVIPGANNALLPCVMEKHLPILRSAGMILTQLEIPLETVEFLCNLAHQLQIPLMLDPAPARPIPRRMLRCVTWLTPNETETCAFSGIAPADLTPATAPEIARKLQSSGSANVIIKMGKLGACLLGADGEAKWVPAFKVKAVDSTAAGDAFNGALAVALMQGMDPEQAVRYAAATGALSTTRAGAQPSMPTAQEVAALLNGRARPAHAAH